jgi:hypothetical protein
MRSRQLHSLRVHDHDPTQLRQLRADRLELGQEPGVLDEGDDGVAVRGDVLHLLRRQRVVQAHRGPAGVEHREVGDQVLRPVPGHDHGELAGLEPE